MKKLKEHEDFSKILDLEKEEIIRLSDDEKNQIIGGNAAADTVATGYGMCICGPTECCKPGPPIPR